MLVVTEVLGALRMVLRAVRRAPGHVCVLIGVLWLVPGALIVAGCLVGAAVGMRTWALRRPVSFSRVVGPVRGCWWRLVLRNRWTELADNCRLAVPGVPEIRRTSAGWPHVRLIVRPAMGQTITTFEQACEALRTALGAARLRVEQVHVRDVMLTFTVGDELRVPFAAQVSDGTSLDTVAIGRTERGDQWRLAIGPHTLVAGCSGAGKGSVFWSFVFGLAPAIQDGRVQLHGIDLKGGMEILMGHPLFTTTATDEAEAVVSLERLVGLMRERNREYAGRQRSHQPTVDRPLHVVMIDELAALTAYSTDRDLQRRAEKAINLLCSQGRAPGFMVFACLQDPRKEVIPSRGLFTQMVGLRLKDQSETTMVLGDTVAQGGALCHRITRDVPGTGYVVPEDGGPPMRVRAGFVPDELIREVAAKYAAPLQVELEVQPADADDRPRARPRTGEVAS